MLNFQQNMPRCPEIITHSVNLKTTVEGTLEYPEAGSSPSDDSKDEGKGKVFLKKFAVQLHLSPETWGEVPFVLMSLTKREKK